MDDNIATNNLECFKEILTVHSIVDLVVKNSSDAALLEADLQHLTAILDQYQEQPHLLDTYIGNLISKLIELIKHEESPKSAFHQYFKYIYLFTKVRGYKYITPLFPHEVADLTFVLKLIQHQSLSDYQTWETRYVLLLWLAIASIIPFDLKKLDGFCSDAILNGILNTALQYLTVSDKCKDAAAYLIAKFLTRTDLKSEMLPEFFNWALNVFQNAKKKTMAGMNDISGVVTAFTLIFKHGRREDLVLYAPKIFNCVTSMGIIELNSTLLRKLAVKFVQRVGLVFLAPRIAAWRYTRGSRSLVQNLKAESNEIRYNTDATHQLVTEENFFVPEEVEAVLEFLITALKDKDTIVRWSAAKGIGRITCCLPSELADEVVGSLLECFTYSEVDTAWHGASLALAELGRRGLLLPSRLDKVVLIVLKALTYEERRGSYSVGSHVRDAACYVCWSFARAYDAEIINPFILDIARSLLVVTLFDREVNCRRAASAAFQENVGRQGSFPHGIDIVTITDYYSVGNRTNCYTNLSVFVAGFPEYTYCLIDHLFKDKISHWDSDIRKLTSKALFELTKTAPNYISGTVIPALVKEITSIDLNTKHGAILSLAEVIYSLYLYHNDQKTTFNLSNDLFADIKCLVAKLHSSNQFRGLGGDLMRNAICKLIENISLSKMEINETDILEGWLFIIEDTLSQAETVIQNGAISALTQFCLQYVKETSRFCSGDIVKRYCNNLKSKSKFDRMGFSLALGALPSFMLLVDLKYVLEALLQSAKIDKVKINAGLYAEARRNSIQSLVSIYTSVGVTNELLSLHLNQVFECFFHAINDYTIDSRGDVGAWVRESAMNALVDVSHLLVQAERPPDEKLCFKITCCLMQQSSEKIDRTRAHAGNLLLKFIHMSPTTMFIPRLTELMSVLTRDMIDVFNWSAPALCFQVITKLLHLQEYQYYILLGLTTSIGGLTESIVRHSSDHFLAFLVLHRTSEKAIDEIMNNLLKIMKSHKKDDRIMIPMLKMLDLIFYSGSLDIYADEMKSKTFLLQLVILLKEEMKGCTEPKKFLASIVVFCSLVQFPGEVRTKSLQQLVIYLGHKYPRIRCGTAEQLYTTILTYEDAIPEECLVELTAILTETSWDAAVDTLRPIQNKICVLLNIPQPKLKQNAPAMPVTPTDDLDSYQDLVNRHGF